MRWTEERIRRLRFALPELDGERLRAVRAIIDAAYQEGFTDGVRGVGSGSSEDGASRGHFLVAAPVVGK